MPEFLRHADDGDPRSLRVGAAEANALADRVDAGELLPREHFVDHADVHRRIAVGSRESSPAHDRHAERGEVVGADVLEVDVQLLPLRGYRPSLDGHVGLHVPSAERDSVSRAHTLDSGDRRESRVELFVERALLLVVVVCRGGERDPRREHSALIEAEIGADERAVAAQEKRRNDQQHHRERHFSHGERVAQPATTAPARLGAPAVAERGVEVDARRTQRGDEPEDHTRDRRQEYRKKQHAAIHGERDVERHIAIGEREPEQPDAEFREHRADGAAGERE